METIMELIREKYIDTCDKIIDSTMNDEGLDYEELSDYQKGIVDGIEKVKQCL